jgi:predicted dehydrogenase
MVTAPLRAAIIGCGRMGCGAPHAATAARRTHAAGFAEHPSTQLIALCDADPERARLCAERWDVPRSFTDAWEMLRETRPDIVSIATPDDTHCALLTLVLSEASVLGVLLEKPVALNANDALAALALCSRSGTPVAVNYSRRYLPSHEVLRRALLNGELGSIQCVTGYYTKGTFHNGTHWLDLARFLFGEVREVLGFQGSSGPKGDPSYDARLSFETGVRGSLIACDSSAFSVFEMDIVGTRARARVIDSGLTIETSPIGPSTLDEGYIILQQPRITRETGMDAATLHVVEDLVESIQEHRPPRCSVEDGAKAVVIAEAIRESAQLGRAVRTNLTL